MYQYNRQIHMEPMKKQKKKKKKMVYRIQRQETNEPLCTYFIFNAIAIGFIPSNGYTAIIYFRSSLNQLPYYLVVVSLLRLMKFLKNFKFFKHSPLNK